MAVDTLGLLLAVHVTPANEHERAQVKELAEAVQDVNHHSAEVAFVIQGYIGDNPKNDASAEAIELIVVNLPEAKKGFCFLPRRWAVERSFAWTALFISWRLPSSCNKLSSKPSLRCSKVHNSF